MVLATIAAPFSEPYYLGGAVVTNLVPVPFDVALNGRPFMLQLDKQAIEAWGVYPRRQSLPIVRDQADSGDEPGEHSVSPEQFWRRSQQTWHKGAGQSWLDWPGADRDRFRSSKGIDCWTQKQLTLLNDTQRVRTSANSGLTMCVAGSRMYMGDGNSLLYTTNTTVYTAVTGTPASACTSVTSDGYNVYAAYGSNGVYTTNTGSSAATQLVTSGSVSLVAYVKGRLMAANANSIYNITSSTPAALPSALFTHSNTGFSWVGFTQAPGFIYAAGYAGGRSEIYSITITSTGTALGAPTIAETLPEGEVVRSICGYQGFLLIGSDKGVRLASINTDGSLVLGGLLSTASVRCFDPADRFVWFGWTNYDGTSTGLGRVDLSVFTNTLVPAYASDLMATTQGVVGSTVLFGSTRLFTVDGSGVWAEKVGTPVTSGTLLSGFIGYDVADLKQAVFLDLRHEPLASGAAVSAALAHDNGTFTTVGTSAAVGATAPDPFYLNGTRGERYEIQLTLSASASAPTLTRYTLRGDVTPQASSQFIVPLVISDEVDAYDSDYYQSTSADVAALIDLHADQTIFPFQFGTDTYLVKMTDFDWLPQHRSAHTKGDFNGVFVAQLRHISG